MKSLGLNLEHLQSFVALLQQGSALKAAHSLGHTQPTISRHLKDLQLAIGQPILRQAGRKLVPTDLGRSLFETASRHLQQLDNELQFVIKNSADPQNITVKIGGRREILARVAGRLKFPGKLQLNSMAGDEVEEKMRSAALDIAITQRQVDHFEYVRQTFGYDEPTVIVPKKWLQNKTWVSEASKYPFAAYEQRTSDLEKYLGGNKCPINYSANDWRLIEEQVRNGLSWAIVPSGFLTENSGYAIVPASSLSQKTALYIYWRRDLRKFDWFRGLLRNLLDLK